MDTYSVMYLIGAVVTTIITTRNVIQIPGAYFSKDDPSPILFGILAGIVWPIFAAGYLATNGLTKLQELITFGIKK